MHRFIVCENDSQLVKYLTVSLLAKYPDCEVIPYKESGKLLNDMHSLPQEAILLIGCTIAYAEKVKLIQEIANLRPSIIIVFMDAFMKLSSNTSYAHQCYSIYKPEVIDDLGEAMEKAITLLDDNKSKLCVPLKDRVVILESEDIVCLERNRRKTQITSEHQVCSVSWNLEQLLSKLPSSFIICHRSYVVNLGKVKVYRRTEFIMNNGITIPIGRSYVASVRQQVQSYFNQH